MAWSATILLNTGNYITVDNLVSVDRKKLSDGSTIKITDFESFQLPKGQLSFIGEKDIVAIHSNEIKYVQLSQD